MTALTPALRDQHEQKEAIIRKGIDGFREVGEALQWIRDNRTYLETHETFEDYCREQWDISRVHAHRLIDAAEVVSTLPMGNTITSERVARAVAKVEPSVRVEVVEKAVAHAKSQGRDRITARDVEGVMDVTPIPKTARRTPTRFSLESHIAQTEMLLEMRFEAVPQSNRREYLHRVYQFAAQHLERKFPGPWAGSELEAIA